MSDNDINYNNIDLNKIEKNSGSFLDSLISPRLPGLNRDGSITNNIRLKFRRKSPRNIDSTQEYKKDQNKAYKQNSDGNTSPAMLRRILSDVSVETYINDIGLYGLRYDLDAVKDDVQELQRKCKQLSCSIDSITLDTMNLTIGESIGAGASGSNIYSCTVDGFICAVKMINKSLVTHETKKQIMTEIKILCKLAPHKNIVRYLFHKRIKNNICIFMTQYHGTLSQYIQKIHKDKSKIVLKELIFILVSIAEGLKYLHENNIVHRDLKPDNIFVNYKAKQISNVAIGDFDTALSLNKHQADICIGTTGYIAPEVLTCNNVNKYSTKADIFSFGMLIYELIVGLPPYYYLSRPFNVSNAIIAGELPNIPDNINPNYQPLIQIHKTCLDTNPEQRPEIANIAYILKQIQ